MTTINIDPNIYIVYKLKAGKFGTELIFHGLVSDKLELADLTDDGWTGMRVGRDWTPNVSGGFVGYRDNAKSPKGKKQNDYLDMSLV